MSSATLFLIGDNNNTTVVDGELGIVTRVTAYDLPVYTGAYEVDPSFETAVLETANKALTDNIVVNSIEVQRVSNPSGGKTVYIGGII